MGRTSSAVLAAGTALLLASQAIAQTTPAAPPGAAAAVRLTLDDAIERAVKASHRIGESTAREEAARAVVSSRAAADMPIVTVLAGYTRTNHVQEYGLQLPGQPPKIIYPDVPDNWRSRLDLQWLVFTSGRMSALERAAQSDAVAAGKDIEALRADVRLETAQAFWGVVTSAEAARVVGEALKRMDAHVKDTKNMLQVGVLAQSDVYSAEAQRSRQQLLLIEAQNARAVAEANLRRLTGLPGDTAIEPVAALDDQVAVPPGIDRLLEQARAARPELAALQQRINAMKERRAATSAALLPTVGVAAGFDYARPNPRIFPRAAKWNDSWDLSVNVGWQLWDGGRAKSDAAELAANQRALEERLAELESVLDFDVRQRRLDLDSARASIQAASDAVRSADEARRVVTDRFAAGVAQATEVVDAQVALLQAELDRTRALATTRLAQSRLDRALGK
jgi:outer membrane protein TolC